MMGVIFLLIEFTIRNFSIILSGLYDCDLSRPAFLIEFLTYSINSSNEKLNQNILLTTNI
jgi:hypothetical protein